MLHSLAPSTVITSLPVLTSTVTRSPAVKPARAIQTRASMTSVCCALYPSASGTVRLAEVNLDGAGGFDGDGERCDTMGLVIGLASLVASRIEPSGEHLLLP